MGFESYLTVLTWVGGVIGFVMSFALGANEAANALGTVVGTKTLRLRTAVIFGAVFEFLGVLFLGRLVSSTISSGVIQPETFEDPVDFVAGMFSAMLSASTFLLLATVFKLPVSSTHCIVGSVIGFGVAGTGTVALRRTWRVILGVLASWVVSPIVGCVLSFLVLKLVQRTILLSRDPNRRSLQLLPLFTGATVGVVVMIVMAAQTRAWGFPTWYIFPVAFAAFVATALIVTIFNSRSSSSQSAQNFMMQIRRQSQSKKASQNFNKLIDDFGSDNEEDRAFNEYHSDSDSHPHSNDTLAHMLTETPGDGHKLMPMGVVPYEDEKERTLKPKRLKNGFHSLAMGGSEMTGRSNSASPVPLLDAGEAYECDEDPDDMRFAVDDQEDFGVVEIGGPGTRQKFEPPRPYSNSSLDTPPPATSGLTLDALYAKANPFSSTRRDSTKNRRKAFEVESTDADNPFMDLPPEIQLVERRFRPLLLLTSAALAFAHGGNDVANAVGPFSVIWEYHKSGDFLELGSQLPFGILAIGGVGIALGVGLLGYKVIETVGSRITALTPTSGFAAQFATAATVNFASFLKLPVSSTSVLVGALVGVGLAKRQRGALDRRLLLKIFGGWLVTFVLGFSLCAAVFELVSHLK